jgi:hypothetical protein
LIRLANVNLIRAVSAEEMYKAVKKELSKSTIFVGAAAVADYAPANAAEGKIKKDGRDFTILREFLSVCEYDTYFPSGKCLAESRKWLVVDARGKNRRPSCDRGRPHFCRARTIRRGLRFSIWATIASS